jgi:hypothetical protein
MLTASAEVTILASHAVVAIHRVSLYLALIISNGAAGRIRPGKVRTFPPSPVIHQLSRKEVSHVHPNVASQFASKRYREVLAQAEQQRMARHLVKLARASRRAERAERRMRQALRKALRLRSELEQ